MATKKQVEKAAKLYALAVIAHTDGGGSSEEGDCMRSIAIEKAKRELKRLGYDAADLLTEVDCLQAAGVEEITEYSPDNNWLP